MVVTIKSGDIVGLFRAFPPSEEEKFVETNGGVIVENLVFSEPLECYEYVDGEVRLKENWEAIKEALENDMEAETPPLDVAKATKQKGINMAYEGELSAILDKYPDVETKTWDKQESEARAWKTDNSADTPLLDALAQNRQMDMAELVDRVIAKADAWIALSGAATGKRQRLEDEIQAATTVEEVDAITW